MEVHLARVAFEVSLANVARTRFRNLDSIVLSEMEMGEWCG